MVFPEFTKLKKILHLFILSAEIYSQAKFILNYTLKMRKIYVILLCRLY